MSSKQVRDALHGAIDQETASFYPKFCKVGKGKYAEGDKFLGVVVREQPRIARRFRVLILRCVRSLLRYSYDEFGPAA